MPVADSDGGKRDGLKPACQSDAMDGDTEILKDRIRTGCLVSVFIISRIGVELFLYFRNGDCFRECYLLRSVRS